jgi:hypothetical protein
VPGRRAALAAIVLAVALGAGCAGEDDDTLTPLSIAGPAPTPPGSAVTTVAAGPTTPGGLPRPTAGTTSVTTSDETAPTGDWDGVAYDVGRIERIGTEGAYTTIDLDRWSYRGGDGPPVDATGLTSEPVVGWWRERPFTNQNVRLRTFVLAPDVEILTLDPAGRAAACSRATDPPPASDLAWVEAGSDALDDATDEGTFALITYSDTGQVARLRLTHGC